LPDGGICQIFQGSIEKAVEKVDLLLRHLSFL
jgi:hypothetical protein